MPNLKLKAALILHYGSQAAASKALGVSERRLSRLIHGYDEPSPKEVKIIEKLGVEFDPEPKRPLAA